MSISLGLFGDWANTGSLIRALHAGEGMLLVGETGTNSAAFGFN
jgi:hypothetical protein